MELLFGTLFLSTFGFMMAFAYLSIRGVQKLRDGDAPKSSLSRDGMEERLQAAAASSN